MEILKDIDSVQLHNTIVTLGKFDGFHLGHQKLVETAVSLKAKAQSTSSANLQKPSVVVFTFDIHPLRILKNEEMPTISIREERERAPHPSGVDYVLEFPFNKETMAMEPEEFVRKILIETLDTKVIVIGEDFQFGKDRKGNAELLKRLGTQLGFEVEVVPKVQADIDGQRTEISSTRIKEEIRLGNMEHVQALLGRAYSITGEVVQGKHLGRTIGFPTLNMDVPLHKILPPDGVYATKTTVLSMHHTKKAIPGITNIGLRPTFDDGEKRTVETHLFDYEGDLYGSTVTVEFFRFIRPEQKFSGIGELTEQMKKDEAFARQYFEME